MMKIIKAFISLLLVACIIGCNFNNGIVEEYSTDDNKPIENDDNSIKVNAYDYIIQVMSEPEYWDEERMHDYFTDEEIELRKDKIPNGSGWYLSDVNTASFSRGYESNFTYDFANFTARYDDGVVIEEYDFKNDQMKAYYSDEPDVLQFTSEEPLIGVDAYDDEGNMSRLNIKEAGMSVYYIGDFENSKVHFIKNSMLNYAYQFELAGCPILLQPEGTLESYKNKTVVPVENYVKVNRNCGDYYEARQYEVDILGRPFADKTLINAPWEQEGYVYDIRENKDIQWIDDYTKVLDIVEEVDEIYKSVKYTTDSGEEREIFLPTVAQVCVVFVNLDMYDTYKSGQGVYPNYATTLFTYMVRPLLKEAFGKDLVYYCDMKNLKNEILLPVPRDYVDDETFKRFGFPLGKDSSDGAVNIFKTPREEWGGIRYKWLTPDTGIVGGNDEEYIEMSYVCTAFGIEFPYSDLYLLNLRIATSEDYQKELGLR